MKPIRLVVTGTFLCTQLRTHKYFNSVIVWTPKFLPYAKIFLAWEKGVLVLDLNQIFIGNSTTIGDVKPIGSLILSKMGKNYVIQLRHHDPLNATPESVLL